LEFKDIKLTCQVQVDRLTEAVGYYL